jgi:hypothetical protein
MVGAATVDVPATEVEMPTLSREDMLGPSEAVLQHRLDKMNELCDILDELDPSLKGRCWVTNAVMWHYSLRLRTAEPGAFLAVTVDFENLDGDELLKYAEQVLASNIG